MPANPIFGRYKAVCTFNGPPKCEGSRFFDYGVSAGLRPGDRLPPDPTDAEFGKCPRCKRHLMVVIQAPELPLPAPPVGFDRIPEK